MKTTGRIASALLSLAAFSSLPVAAADNPMDAAGIQHNMYLGCLQETGNSSADALARVVEKCGYEPGMPLEAFIAKYHPLTEMDPTRLVAEKMASQRSSFSKYEFSFFERIDEIVMSASDMKEAGEMLESLESEAIARLDAKSANGRVVLGSLSVARHSVAYWSVRADLEEKGASTAKMRWWKWLLVAAADVGGYALSHDVGAAASVSDVAHDWLDSP